MQLESIDDNISGLLSKEISEKKGVQVSKTPSWVYKKNVGLEYWQVIEGKKSFPGYLTAGSLQMGLFPGFS